MRPGDADRERRDRSWIAALLGYGEFLIDAVVAFALIVGGVMSDQPGPVCHLRRIDRQAEDAGDHHQRGEATLIRRWGRRSRLQAPFAVDAVFIGQRDRHRRYPDRVMPYPL